MRNFYFCVMLKINNVFDILHSVLDEIESYLPEDVVSTLFDVVHDDNRWRLYKVNWHVTVYYGKNLPQYNLKEFINNNMHKNFRFVIEAIGYNTETMAFKVRPLDEFMTMNEIPHITIGSFAGSPPAGSNRIKKWYEINNLSHIVEGTLIRVY